MVSEVNFTGCSYPRQKYLRDRLRDLVKFTFRPYPLYNALRGTLLFEVNFTGRGNPCQKYPRGRLGCSVKFAFRADPRQKALRGTFAS